MSFSQEFEGVLDVCPLRLTWQIGPNLPVAWEGGVAGIIGDEIILTGGLWMPPRAKLILLCQLHVIGAHYWIGVRSAEDIKFAAHHARLH